ncbi:MAG: choice-of-anchor D domain-containing protein [Candidatus Sulfotelmatobacter sp.]
MRALISFKLSLAALLFVLVAPRSILLAQTCTLPPANMIAWWSADGIVVDIQGGHNGKLVNATYGTGEVGKAFSFNGTNAYVQVPNNKLWDFGTEDFTIDLWTNFTAVRNSGSLERLDNVFIGDDNGAEDQNKWVFDLSDGVLNFHINGAIGPQWLAQTPFSPTPGTWYFLAVTKASGVYTIWIDGVPSTSTSQTYTTPIPPPTAPLTIGEAEGLGYFDGLLDETEIFTRALATSEVEAIYNAGSAGKCKPAKLSPASFSFAPGPLDITGKPEKFTLTNYQNATTLNISSFALGGADPEDFAISANTCVATLKPLAKCTISVTFTPTATSERNAQLTATDDAYNTPQVAQLIGLPEASLAPASANFGTVKSGSSKTLKFTLTNNQAVALNISSIAFGGTDPTDFSVSSPPCASSLAPKAKCSISVTFTPGAAGSLSAVLIVTDDANNSPQQAPLQGAGGGSPISVFGTGYTAGGPGLAAVGTVDGNFSLLSCPTGACVSNGNGSYDAFVTLTDQYPFPTWLADTSSAQWIGPANGGNEATINPSGLYQYRETFDLTGFKLATVVLTGSYATDNSGYIQLNGVTVGPANSSFSSLTDFTLKSGFKQGINTLDFFVTNGPVGGTYNPTGLIVELSGAGTRTAAAEKSSF